MKKFINSSKFGDDLLFISNLGLGDLVLRDVPRARHELAVPRVAVGHKGDLGCAEPVVVYFFLFFLF